MKSEIIWISVQLNAKCFKPDMTGVVLRNGLAFSATTGSLRFFYMQCSGTQICTPGD